MLQIIVTVGIVVAAVAITFFLMFPADSEPTLVRFVETNIEKSAAVRIEVVSSTDELQNLGARIYIAQLLERLGRIASWSGLFRNRYEENAASELGLAKKGDVGRTTERYILATEVNEQQLRITLKDLRTGDVKSGTFAIPNTLRSVVERLRKVQPEVTDVKFRLEGNTLNVVAVVNYPFTRELIVGVDERDFRKYSVKSMEVPFSVPNVTPGRRVELDLRPLNYAGVGLTSYRRAFLVEHAPKPVERITYEFVGGRIVYRWTHANPPLQELRFIVETPSGTHQTENVSWSEELKLGKLYEVKVKVVARFGESETRSILVKTPPSRPEVQVSQEGANLRLQLKNTCDYPVNFQIKVAGRTYDVDSDSFVWQIPVPGASYKITVTAVSDTLSSEPVVLDVNTRK